MENTKVSKLLLVWLWTQGHKVKEYKEAEGITTVHDTDEYKFDVSGSYGGFRVEYTHNRFSFYDGDKKLKDTDLNELR
mgnify:FL=1